MTALDEELEHFVSALPPPPPPPPPHQQLQQPEGQQPPVAMPPPAYDEAVATALMSSGARTRKKAGRIRHAAPPVPVVSLQEQGDSRLLETLQDIGFDLVDEPFASELSRKYLSSQQKADNDALATEEEETEDDGPHLFDQQQPPWPDLLHAELADMPATSLFSLSSQPQQDERQPPRPLPPVSPSAPQQEQLQQLDSKLRRARLSSSSLVSSGSDSETVSSEATALVDHVRLGRRDNFVCHFDGCTKSYNKQSHLKAHLRRHTGRSAAGLGCIIFY